MVPPLWLDALPTVLGAALCPDAWTTVLSAALYPSGVSGGPGLLPMQAATARTIVAPAAASGRALRRFIGLPARCGCGAQAATAVPRLRASAALPGSALAVLGLLVLPSSPPD